MYEQITRWASPERQRELEAKIKLVAFDSDIDYPLPIEILPDSDQGFVRVDYERDDEDEYCTGESTQHSGPLDQLIAEPLARAWEAPGSVQIAGLTAPEVIELLGCQSYSDSFKMVVPDVAAATWTGVPFRVNELSLGSLDGELVLIPRES